MSSLTRTEARTRAGVVRDPQYTLDIDLDRGDETFESRTVLTFDATPGADTFVDLKARSVRSATLNGRPLDLATWDDGRLPLPDLAEHNELVVEATMAYSHDGSGLHRSVDPADGEHYVWGHSFMDAAPRVFACFDQPDLKAPYTITVKAPATWVVVGNGACRVGDGGVWQLATTRPLATYFVTLCAGPWAVRRAEHDGIGLGFFARASLADALDANLPAMLEVTTRSFDYFHELFGIRYPFGDYDQVFVPDFNAGAMENPGCVVIRDEYLFRGAATRGELQGRESTIAHEMAHMWFGDLVTLAWWDDLWLNESFAEYMAGRALVGTGLYPDAWARQSIIRKAWGYAAERSPSTHPVASNGSQDALSALQNFDGISYAKGSAVLQQLIASIGDDTFVMGVRDYLEAHAFGNASLTDFFGAMESAHGSSLTDWTRNWLTTAGLDRIAVDVECDDAGVVTSAVLRREAPAEHPAVRFHAIDVAGYTDGKRVAHVDLRLEADGQPLPELVGSPRPALVLPNASDRTWATVVLDDASLASLVHELPLLADAEARCVVWNALRDGVALASVDPRLVVDVAAAALPVETSDDILATVAGYVTGRVVGRVLPDAERAAARERLADAGHAALDAAEPGSGRALAAARLVADTSADVAALRAWLAGTGLPQGLADDADFRWRVAGRLAELGDLTVAELDGLRAQDTTVTGTLAYLRARASRPTADDKAWAWGELTGRATGWSNHELNALAEGFWHGPDDVLAPYVERYFADVPAMCAWVGDDAMARVAKLAYPTLVTREVLAASRAAQERDDLTAAVRRGIVDSQAVLEEVRAAREAFPG